MRSAASFGILSALSAAPANDDKEAGMPDTSDPPHPILEKRDHCPGCRRTATRTLYREPLDSPGITRYMQAHYGHRVERDFAGYDYELAQCEHCGLAFQAQVPAPALLAE